MRTVLLLLPFLLLTACDGMQSGNRPMIKGEIVRVKPNGFSVKEKHHYAFVQTDANYAPEQMKDLTGRMVEIYGSESKSKNPDGSVTSTYSIDRIVFLDERAKPEKVVKPVKAKAIATKPAKVKK